MPVRLGKPMGQHFFPVDEYLLTLLLRMQRIDRIKETLSRDLDQLFGNAIHTLVTPGSELSVQERARIMADISECFKSYDTLGTQEDAEEILTAKIMRPFVNRVRLLSILFHIWSSDNQADNLHWSFGCPTFPRHATHTLPFSAPLCRWWRNSYSRHAIHAIHRFPNGGQTKYDGHVAIVLLPSRQLSRPAPRRFGWEPAGYIV